MKFKYIKVTLPIITSIALVTFATVNVNASIDSKTASGFSQYCSQNSGVCRKVDFSDAAIGTVSCPAQNQSVSEVLVHAGDGQAVYRLPQDGFSYIINGNAATVWLSGHPHAISWIGVVCGNTTSQNPSPSLAPTPTPSPSVNPSASTPTPTQTQTTGGANGDDNNQNQSQTQNNYQTVNVNINQTRVLGARIPERLPDTGVSVLDLASFFSVAPFGLVLTRFSRGKGIWRRKEELGSFATGKFEERNKGLDNL